MSNYELKQAEKKARYAEKAKELRAEANAMHEQNCRELSYIPPGQPILVGHHSERSHRRHLEKINNRTHKAINTEKKADYYEYRANCVNSAISSEDEDAIAKLKEKLANIERRQLEMKRINKEFRKGGIDAITNITDEERESIKNFLVRFSYEKVPFPAYELSNNSANIRRIKARIAQLEKESTRQEQEPIKGDGFIITENKEDVRLWVEFDNKPEKEICQIMRRNGFKWSPTRKAWIRLLNNAARYAAKSISEQINALKKSS